MHLAFKRQDLDLGYDRGVDPGDLAGLPHHTAWLSHSTRQPCASMEHRCLMCFGRGGQDHGELSRWCRC